ncbi:MAG: hypothetical protein LBI34_01155 [Puniceicoccales bacterium]|jgi:hypothetical protein|nr:hypothetical protein [Puniceicoccales bacterium]
MAFEKMHFSSVDNQRCAGERIQTWKYETVDGQAEVIGNGYFAPVSESLRVNDLIHIIQMDGNREFAVLNYSVRVRVNEFAEGTRDRALIALPDREGVITAKVVFGDISTDATKTISFDGSRTIKSAYATLLGKWGGSETATLTISTVSGSPAAVASATISAPETYGKTQAFTVSTVRADGSFSVALDVTGTTADSGSIVVHIFAE